MTKKQQTQILSYVQTNLSEDDKKGLTTLSFSNEKDEDATEYFCHSRYGYLSMIEVHEEYQGRGIARRVLTLVTEAAQQYGINLYAVPCPHCYSTISSILEDNGWEAERGDSYNMYI